MDVKRALNLLPIFVVVSTFVGIAVAVVVYLGFPMAGVASTLFSTGLALALTFALAYFFAHKPAASPPDHH
jgi:hypothetical protein